MRWTPENRSPPRSSRGPTKSNWCTPLGRGAATGGEGVPRGWEDGWPTKPCRLRSREMVQSAGRGSTPSCGSCYCMAKGPRCASRVWTKRWRRSQTRRSTASGVLEARRWGARECLCAQAGVAGSSRVSHVYSQGVEWPKARHLSTGRSPARSQRIASERDWVSSYSRPPFGGESRRRSLRRPRCAATHRGLTS
jgi:hypothetical protein